MKKFQEMNSQENKNKFLNSIKFEEDPDRAMLLKIQEDLEKMGINEENVHKLTKKLTEAQKQKLLSLYKEQIENYEKSIEKHKKNIIAIRKKLG